MSKEYFAKKADGSYDNRQCCFCGAYVCDCNKLSDRVCEVCGETFKGVHYFSWAIHQAVCKVERRRNETRLG